jgi:hypothetical protein
MWSSRPVKRLLCPRLSTGSNEPSRPRGTSVRGGPSSVGARGQNSVGGNPAFDPRLFERHGAAWTAFMPIVPGPDGSTSGLEINDVTAAAARGALLVFRLVSMHTSAR